MISHFKAATLHFALAVLLPCFAVAQAKQSPAPPAPIPTQIFTAKKAFIANGGADEMDEDNPHFSGGPDRAYNQFYAGMKGWGRYDLVSSPAEADLVLEISLDSSAVVLNTKGSPYTPQFRLKIRDPKTNGLLWSLNSRADFGFGQSASDKNFDSALDRLVNDLRMLGAQSQPAVGSANRP
ncbi:MAG TPA: hypothetical protein VMD99_02400 [Terriglobales bacterium]|nr:hypothetical protein [Terriglobales bacterium]